MFNKADINVEPFVYSSNITHVIFLSYKNRLVSFEWRPSMGLCWEFIPSYLPCQVHPYTSTHQGEVYQCPIYLEAHQLEVIDSGEEYSESAITRLCVFHQISLMLSSMQFEGTVM